ncbi:MAG: hypothetical protein DRN64_04880, partial [Thaumarchaeota archaeon]
QQSFIIQAILGAAVEIQHQMIPSHGLSRLDDRPSNININPGSENPSKQFRTSGPPEIGRV